MAKYMEHKRDTELFVAGSLEGLLPEDSVARAIWAGLEQLDFGLYDALHKNDAAGRSALNPRCLTAPITTRYNWMRLRRRGYSVSCPKTALSIAWRRVYRPNTTLMLLSGIWEPMVPAKTG